MTTPVVKTYAPRLFRCNITGSIPGEQIVNTVWLQADASTVITADFAQKIADKVRDTWAKYIQGGIGTTPAQAALFHTGTSWQSVSCYAVDAAGRATSQAEAVFAAGVKGTGAGAMPPQIAVVGTLLTAVPGRSGRGRIFLGGLGTGLLGPDGRMAANNKEAMSTALAAFYTELRNVPAGADLFRPVVVSPTKGTANKILKVQVGDVLDTMRSRRGKLVEARASAIVDTA